MTKFRKKILATIFSVGVILTGWNMSYGLLLELTELPNFCLTKADKYPKHFNWYIDEKNRKFDIFGWISFLCSPFRSLSDNICCTEILLQNWNKIGENYKEREKAEKYYAAMAIKALVANLPAFEKALAVAEGKKKLGFFETVDPELRHYLNQPSILSMWTGEVYMRLAYFYAKYGNYTKAAEYFFKAKEMKSYKGNRNYGYSTSSSWLLYNIVIPGVNAGQFDHQSVDTMVDHLIDELTSKKDEHGFAYDDIYEKLNSIAYELYVVNPQKERFMKIMDILIMIMEKKLEDKDSAVDPLDIYPELTTITIGPKGLITQRSFFQVVAEAVKVFKEKGMDISDIIEKSERLKEKILKSIEKKEQELLQTTRQRLQKGEYIDRYKSKLKICHNIKILTYTYFVSIYKNAKDEEKEKYYNQKLHELKSQKPNYDEILRL